MHDFQMYMEAVGLEAQHSLPFRKPGWQVVLYRFDLESVSRNYLERNEKAYCRTKRLKFLSRCSIFRKDARTFEIE